MKNIISVLLFAAVLLASPAYAEKSLGPDEFTSVDELAIAIAAYFPKVQGAVTAVEGGRLTIALGAKNGLKTGMELTLWRDGKEILHPVTKAVIGRAEDEVGTIEVVSVEDASSTAAVRKQLLEPVVGDRARTTPKKISLGVLPLRNDRTEIIQGLTERLGELGRFTVLGNDKVAAFLKDKQQRDTALIKEMAGMFSLDAIVTVSIMPSEGKYLTTSKIFYADNDKPLDTIVAVLNLTTRREALGDVRPFFAPMPVKTTSDKLPVLPLKARFFTVADLDGDGAPEFVFSDENELSVYRVDGAGWKELWRETVPAKEKAMQQFRIDAADINGNGRPEIFVTRMLDGRVSSYVVEFQDGVFKRTAEIPGFLRVVRYPGRGNLLIGQDYDAASFYAGQPREYAWSGGSYAPGAAVVLPKGTDLYSFVFANFGDTVPNVVSLDSDSRLVVYSGETRVWRSEEEYSTVESVVTRPLTGIDADLGRTPTDLDKVNVTGDFTVDKSRLMHISGRMIAVDLDGNGKDDLVVAKNSKEFLLTAYKGGALEILAWTGARLEPRWNVKDLPGPVLDIQVLGQERGMQIYGLVKKPGGIFKKDAVAIEKYEGK